MALDDLGKANSSLVVSPQGSLLVLGGNVFQFLAENHRLFAT